MYNHQDLYFLVVHMTFQAPSIRQDANAPAGKDAAEQKAAFQNVTAAGGTVRHGTSTQIEFDMECSSPPKRYIYIYT